MGLEIRSMINHTHILNHRHAVKS